MRPMGLSSERADSQISVSLRSHCSVGSRAAAWRNAWSYRIHMPGWPCLAMRRMMAMYIIREHARSGVSWANRAAKVAKARAQSTVVRIMAWVDLSALRSLSLLSGCEGCHCQGFG